MKKTLKIIGISLVVLGIGFFFLPSKQSFVVGVGMGGGYTFSEYKCFGVYFNNTCYGLLFYNNGMWDNNPEKKKKDSFKTIFQRKIDFWTKGEPKFLCSKAGELINHANRTNRCCAGLKVVGSGCPEDNCGCKFPLPGGITKCTDCGNGICDRENLEDYCNCPEDCKSLKDTCSDGKCEQANGEDKTSCAEDCFINSGKVYSKEYYGKFRKKCEKDRCCLSSVQNAESQNSPLFESNHNSKEGITMQKANCPDGSRAETQYCENSYIWCTKNN